jgi:hypothetical protein
MKHPALRTIYFNTQNTRILNAFVLELCTPIVQYLDYFACKFGIKLLEIFCHIFLSAVSSSINNIFYFDYIINRLHSLAQNIFIGRMSGEEHSEPSME